MLRDLLKDFLDRQRRERAIEALEALDSGRMPRAGATPAAPRLNFDPTGGVREAGGWFSAPAPANWVHDSESLFRSDIANLGAPRMGAPVPTRPPMVSAPGPAPGLMAAPPAPGMPQVAEGTSAPTPGQALGLAAQARMFNLLADAGVDPVKLQQFGQNAEMQEILRRALPGLDPYNQANIAAGKTAALPYSHSAYGTVNQATGTVQETPYAQAQTALAAERARTEQARAGQYEAGAARHEAGAAKASMTWVRRPNGDEELVQVVTGDDGRIRTVPAMSANGAPVVRAAEPDKPATGASPYTKPKSPQEFWNERYQVYTLPMDKRGPEHPPEKATELANADMFQAFPAIKAQVDDMMATAAKLLTTRPDKKAEIQRWLTDGVASLKATGQLPQ